MDSNNRELLARELVSMLKENNVLLQAPTGWGKTTLMLRMLALLAKEGWKVALTAPTLFLLVEKWKELTKMLQGVPNPPRAILTAGAGQYCVYQWSIPQRFCSRCKLYHNVNAEFGSFATFEDINRLTPEDACGYWAQETVLPRYDIIMGHYGRLSKIVDLVHFLFIDEAHEFFIPRISTFKLAEIAQLLGITTEELYSVAVIKELVDEKLYSEGVDPQTEDRLWSLSNMLKKTCWLETDEVHCMDLYELPQRVRVFAATATPPPGWPPEGWGKKIVIEPKIKPRAYIEMHNAFYYRDNYEGLGLQIYLIVRWLKQKFGAKRIIIFSTASARRVISMSIEVCHEPLNPPPEGVVLADAWGKMRVGIDLYHYDAAILTGISLPPTARRRLRAEGRDPDIVETVQAVQLAGRILRPRPSENETYEDVLRKRIVIFADARYAKHIEYLMQFFNILELPADL
jgi:hypothetical protein